MRAIGIHRARRAQDATSAVVARELAISLLQLFNASRETDQPEAMRALAESYEILRDLFARGALEARYHALVARLAGILDPA